MALLRLANGADLKVKLSVTDTLEALATTAAAGDFVELPSDEGPLHVRPSAVLAVVESDERKQAGFFRAG